MIQRAGRGEEHPRRGIVRVWYSPRERFRSVVLRPGEEKSFGRDERANVTIPDDALRGDHFFVSFDGVAFTVRARAPHALLLDGRPSSFGAVRSGGTVVAGKTTFRLFLERRTPPESDEASPHSAEVIAQLARLRDAGGLYGVFDAARDPRISILLSEGIDDHASLYEGDAGAALDDVAPFLVSFVAGSRLLERLVTEGWGRGWGIFASSSMSKKDVRRHFRRFLMVRDEATHARMYFRFYDPRVFREFHKVATPRQRDELMGGLSEIVLEAADGAPLRLAPTSTAQAEVGPATTESAEPGAAG